MTTNKSVNFKVNGMHCGGCANKIKKSLDELGIEQTTEVKVESGMVNVKFNSEESSISVLRDSISKAGFSVESVELE